MIFLTQVSTFESVTKLIGVIVLFIIILVLASFSAKWLGKSSLVNPHTRNISIVEAFRINPNKILEIIKVGDKYLLIGISKDHIEYLTELTEDELSLEDDESKGTTDMNFKKIFDKFTKSAK
ncbi:MAG: flagellar biosynthetic protein FliO [Lachnospiraceae bacterium]|nr:flagellar biosynthetic protein FliO [Lachnospiraceae bacterium]